MKVEVRLLKRVAAGILLGGITGLALAQPYGFGPPAGYGPGYGISPDATRGYGPGYGPGQWGYGPPAGYGPSYGPGQWSYGPPAGYGPGYGGGWGFGPGYGGYGPIPALNLSDDQRAKIVAIQDDMRSKAWDTLGKLQQEQFKLRQLYFSDKLDAAAISSQQKNVDELSRKVTEMRVDAQNRIDAVLTPEQRQTARTYRAW